MPLEYALQFRNTNPNPGPWKFPRSVSLRPNSSLGISNLPDLKTKRSKARVFNFNIMVAGQSGLGKTTFLNTLFNSDLTEPSPQHPSSSTMKITPSTFELEEEGIRLILTTIDTPGFGDQMNRESNFEPVITYIEKQYDNFLDGETSPSNRSKQFDARVHCLLYFLPPSFTKLKDLDIGFLQRLSTKVNVVPVISRADSMTQEELAQYKKLILKEFEKFDIRSYPAFYSSEHDAVKEVEKHIPFAVVGSDKFVSVNGNKVRARQYKWGTVQVENPTHSDAIYIRELLIEKNMQDLIDSTHQVHYANYRGIKIGGSNRPQSFLACDDFYEAQKERNKNKMMEEIQQKEEEMRQRFVSKVREKELELREREEKLNATRQTMLEELETMRRQLADEEASFNELVSAKAKK